MKIIDIGKVLDNVDPKGIGRIRATRFTSQNGPKENAIKYEKWDKNDPFVCNPFLPVNINYIPEIDQSVKIINYDTEKLEVNREYIAGPFTTSHDFNSQTWSHQVEYTTYGATTQDSKNIIHETGVYVKPKSNGSLAEHKDFGIYGKNGSDILFTNNGLELRGGKLISKESANITDRIDLLSYPLMSNNVAKISLKKFPFSLTKRTEVVTETSIESELLSFVVEYQIDDLTLPTKIDYFIYQVDKNSAGEVYSSSGFTQNTDLEPKYTKLINIDNTTGITSTPTFSTLVVTPLDLDPIAQTYIDIRDTLYQLSTDGLASTIADHRTSNTLYTGTSSTDISKYSQYPNFDMHPMYFRPTEHFLNLSSTNTGDTENKLTILDNIIVKTKGPQAGLIYSLSSPSPKETTQEKVEDVTILDPNSGEQSFASVTSDKIYFLSSNTNESNLSVPFVKLDKYEYTQQDYINKIDPNTYSTVRGDVLLKFLKTVYNLFESHVHNLATPLIQADPNFIELQDQITTLENDMLNKSIRIN
jgi:hypothetical protein